LALAASGCGDDAAAPQAAPDAGDDDAHVHEDVPDAALEDAGPDAEVNADPLLVTLEAGALRGQQLEGSRRFLRIPYAQPPVGELRWKAPVPAEGWSGVREEEEFALGCPQNGSAGSMASENEDCLYLNVWQPDEPPAQGAPVMMWIHGGGNFAGSSGDIVSTSADHLWFDGQFFAKNHGVVVVTINYRLGPFGFFSHPELAGEDSPRGNQGLLDQRLAMQWIKENIQAFGGDPDNVTIFGESAGSADVCYHVASPGSRGLFHRAISQSGGCTIRVTGPDPTADTAETQVQKFADAVGCSETADQLACLRELPVAGILANAMQPNPESGMVAAQWRFGVVIDGEGGVLPIDPIEAFDMGDVADVPYILGSNTDEGTLFVLLSDSPPSTQEEYDAALEARFGERAADVGAMYPAEDFDGDFAQALARAFGDSGLVCGTHDTARRAAAAGLSVRMYNFNFPWTVSAGFLGVAHAAEISHVFGSPYMADATSEMIGEEMNAYWARFATSGDPNGAGAPAEWPAFSADEDLRLQLDADWGVLEDFRAEECAFWREVAGVD
jgi:para-nitrobenzyl esterase